MTARRQHSWISPPIEVALLALVLVVGCAPQAERTTTDETTASAETASTSEGTPSTDRVREVARISLEIEREPGRASAILETNGMTVEEFEDLLYAIADNAALTELYESERSITAAGSK